MAAKQFPENRPSDDATFQTADKEFVEARAVAVRLSQSARGERPDQVDILFEVAPGQKAIRDAHTTPSGTAVPAGVGDVGGEVVWCTSSLNGGAAAITFGNLRKAGLDESRCCEKLKADPKAIAYRQALKARGEAPAEADKAVVLLALTRGDLDSTGIGSVGVRLVVQDEEYKGVVRRRVKYVNSIPRAGNEDDVLNLLALVGGSMSPAAAAAAKKASTGTSQAPGAGGGSVAKDEADF